LVCCTDFRFMQLVLTCLKMSNPGFMYSERVSTWGVGVDADVVFPDSTCGSKDRLAGFDRRKGGSRTRPYMDESETWNWIKNIIHHKTKSALHLRLDGTSV
jgi:hypothetical protein